MDVVSTMGSDLPLIRRQQTLTLLLVLPPVMSLVEVSTASSSNLAGYLEIQEVVSTQENYSTCYAAFLFGDLHASLLQR